MSGVRRAMLEMGLATCCLMCDAPDEVASQRCRDCIIRHKEMREKVSNLPQESLVSQWAKELLQMLARPSSYEHDENHGEWMEVYSTLLGGPARMSKPITEEEVKEAFATARNRRKINPLRDIANKSQWKDATPSAGEVAKFNAELPENLVDSSGVRTVPSRIIPESDRSDRQGEDPELTDRVAAQQAAEGAPSDMIDALVDLEVGEKRIRRKQWSDLVGDVDDLLED